MTKLQYPLCGPQVCLQRAACLTCQLYRQFKGTILLTVHIVNSSLLESRCTGTEVLLYADGVAAWRCSFQHMWELQYLLKHNLRLTLQFVRAILFSY